MALVRAVAAAEIALAVLAVFGQEHLLTLLLAALLGTGFAVVGGSWDGCGRAHCPAAVSAGAVRGRSGPGTCW
ncbi:hypothetical protein ACFSTC_18325 [Nonomuraea ferruginea]